MQPSAHRYFYINKPCGMLSQFIGQDDTKIMLGELDFNFPEGIHAIGRLDKHSEGLLILTTNQRVTKLLFQGEVPHKRTYLVKVRYAVSQQTVEALRTGVDIRIKGGEYYSTTPCEVEIVDKPAGLYNREVEPREYSPVTWLLITLTEGKYHQIRKMVSNVGHRCLRLIRISIEDLVLGDLLPGGVHEVDEEAFFKKLKIENWQQPALPRYNS